MCTSTKDDAKITVIKIHEQYCKAISFVLGSKILIASFRGIQVCSSVMPLLVTDTTMSCYRH